MGGKELWRDRLFHHSVFVWARVKHRSYLHRFKLLDSPVGPTCGFKEEDVEHVFFQCPRFLSEREELPQQFGEVPTPETIVGLMLKSQDNWELFGNVTAKAMKELRRIEIQT